MLLLLLACTASPTIEQVEVVPSPDIPAVLVATWSYAGGAAWARLESEEGVLAQVTATPAGAGRWRAVLVGAPPDTPVTVALGGEGEDILETVETTTGADDGTAPWPESMEGEPFDGYIALALSETAGAAGTQWPVIIDGYGRPVWWHAPEDPGDTFTSRVQLDPSAAELWFNTFHLVAGDGSTEGIAGLRRVPLEGGSEEVVELDGVHHDFFVHPDGSLTWAEADPAEVDGQVIDGDRLVTMAPDGSRSVLWSTWDRLTWEEPTSGPDSPWPIVNQLERDAATDTWYVGLRSLGAIAAVDGTTGQTRWLLGSAQGDVAGAPTMTAQHGIDLTAEGLLIFDNGEPGAGSSRGLEVAVRDGQATVLWEAHADPPEYSPFYGDALALPDGSRALLFGTAGRLVRYAEDGTVLQDLRWPPLTTLGFARHSPTIGH